MVTLMAKLSSYLILGVPNVIAFLISKFWISKGLMLHWSASTFKIRKHGHSVNLITVIVLIAMGGNLG